MESTRNPGFVASSHGSSHQIRPSHDAAGDSPRRTAEPSSVAVVSVGSHGAGNSWFWDENKVDIDQWIGSRENLNRKAPYE